MQIITNRKLQRGQVWWFMPIIPALCRPKQKVHQFMASLGYITRSCPKRKEQNKTIGKK
jgi:hypothetical protein